ncbi:MAG: hypothetical protein FWH54_03140 [Methanobrevibacter sp.]|nr:hypothetical protein [Methanobrevibacter sp.]
MNTISCIFHAIKRNTKKPIAITNSYNKASFSLNRAITMPNQFNPKY